MKKYLFILLLTSCTKQIITEQPTEVPYATIMPSSYILKCPPIEFQGSEGSCVCMAVVYQRSIEEFYKNKDSEYSVDKNILSPEFLYNQIKAGDACLSGSSIINALNFIQRNGVCTWGLMPYSDQNGCSTLPTSLQKENASNYKISEYKVTYASDIDGIKNQLNLNHPLTFMFTVDDLYNGADSNFIWNQHGTIKYAPHCATIIGYDDNKNALKIADERGGNWADKGFTWIDYNFFNKVVWECFYMVLTPQAITESSIVIATTSTIKGRITDIVKWNNILNSIPINSEIQLASDGINFSTLYKIVPYNSTGTYGYLAAKKKRYYRLKTLKADNSIIYSQIITIL